MGLAFFNNTASRSKKVAGVSPDYVCEDVIAPVDALRAKITHLLTRREDPDQRESENLLKETTENIRDIINPNAYRLGK